nr:hypothetical protein [Mycobacterium eburneum]
MILGGQTITVINDGDPTAYDGVGDPIYGDPTLTVVNRCSVQQHTAKRDINITDVSLARWRIFAPADAPLTATSRVVMGAATWPLPDDTTVYLMNGEPALWCRHDGAPHHYECYVEEQVG